MLGFFTSRICLAGFCTFSGGIIWPGLPKVPLLGIAVIPTGHTSVNKEFSTFGDIPDYRVPVFSATFPETLPRRFRRRIIEEICWAPNFSHAKRETDQRTRQGRLERQIASGLPDHRRERKQLGSRLCGIAGELRREPRRDYSSDRGRSKKRAQRVSTNISSQGVRGARDWAAIC
jgi:hypothetical protein